MRNSQSRLVKLYSLECKVRVLASYYFATCIFNKKAKKLQSRYFADVIVMMVQLLSRWIEMI